MRHWMLGLVFVLLVAACGSDDVGTTTTAVATTDAVTTSAPSTTAATGTTAPTTTAAVTTMATTTTAAATATGAAAATPSFSGCSPAGDVLPDGEWAGFIEGVTTGGGSTQVSFDLACWFDGAQADLAAAEDGRPTPVEFPPYLRNQNPKVFDFTVAPSAVVHLFGGDVAFTTWQGSLAAGDGCSTTSGYSACAVMVTITGGVAVEFSEPLPEWSGDGRGS